MRRAFAWGAALAILQPSCDGTSSKQVHGGVHKPIAGVLKLTVRGAPGAWWAIL